jgi:two-component system LytT family response regulator
MITNTHHNVIPISNYAATLAEIEHWKEKYYDLQNQITELRNKDKDTMVIKEGGMAKYIRLADIIMMEAESNYSSIFLTDGQHILTSKTLKYWIEKIGDHQDFIRPHRSYLVNKTHIATYQRSSKCLSLTNGHQVQVARSYKF